MAVTSVLHYEVSLLQASSSKNILLFSLNLLFENELKGVSPDCVCMYLPS